MHVLVVDDDPMVQKLLQRGLRSEGHVVDVAADAQQGLHLAQAGVFDVVVLDVSLPGMTGLEVSSGLRAEGNNVPILMLTGRVELSDRLKGFAAGADDYLAKPFAFQELLARLHAIARRGQGVSQHERLVVGDLVLDRRGHEVTRAGQTIKLSPKEFAVLEFLMEHPGQALSRTVILERVWDYSFDGYSNVVDTSIRRLRKAVDRGHDAELIQTVQGLGYKITAV
jgi:two-component system OmpR family response regulator